MKELKCFQFLVKTKIPRQSLTFFIGKFPNRAQNLELTQIATKFRFGEPQLIQLVLDNGEIKNTFFVKFCPVLGNRS